MNDALTWSAGTAYASARAALTSRVSASVIWSVCTRTVSAPTVTTFVVASGTTE